MFCFDSNFSCFLLFALKNVYRFGWFKKKNQKSKKKTQTLHHFKEIFIEKVWGFFRRKWNQSFIPVFHLNLLWVKCSLLLWHKFIIINYYSNGACRCRDILYWFWVLFSSRNLKKGLELKRLKGTHWIVVNNEQGHRGCCRWSQLTMGEGRYILDMLPVHCRANIFLIAHYIIDRIK